MAQEDTTLQDWSNLVSGERVSVAERGRRPYSATVDALTDDSGVVWIIPDSGTGRRAFDYREGILIQTSEPWRTNNHQHSSKP